VRLGLLGLCAVAAALGGCARREPDAAEVRFFSDPPAASVLLSTGQSCIAPCTLSLPWNQGFVARFTKEGFEPSEVAVIVQTVTRERGWTLRAGAFGAIGDTSPLTSFEHRPNPVSVRLRSRGG
jgi:hypothetical protein